MLILASKSPRRQELLNLITPEFLVITQDTDETILPELTPEKAVETLALRKARAVAATHGADVVIGADTVVALGKNILGKPQDEAQALAMLRTLCGKTHLVYTGVAILAPGLERVFCQQTAVTFWEMEEDWLCRYANSGEPLDKAGAYGIQGTGALLVKKIEGDYFNVVGLPVSRLARELSGLF